MMQDTAYKKPAHPVSWSRFFDEHAPTQVLLMARPKFYEIPPPDADGKHANRFAIEGYAQFKADPVSFAAKANAQWHSLCFDTFSDRLGLPLQIMPARKGEPDLVFTADASISMNDGQHGPVTIYSHFQNKQRQNETHVHQAFMQQAMPERFGKATPASSYNKLEGTGDNVYDPYRDLYWCGYIAGHNEVHAMHGRSNKDSHALLTQMTGIETVSLAVDNGFFHIDTSLGFLSRGHVVAYPGGMTPEAYETFKHNAFTRYGLDPKEYLIEVDQEDADRYACNLRCVGNTAVMSNCSKALQDKLRSKGYEVITHDMSAFIASGGSIHCVTNNLNETRIPGGYHQLVMQGLIQPDMQLSAASPTRSAASRTPMSVMRQE